MHYEPGTAGVPNPDVKFDGRDDLYYRTVQGPGNFDVVDYGCADGTPSSPVVAVAVDGSATHNLWAHPEVAVLYTVNYDGDSSTGGFDVWDVSDPTAPTR